VFVIFQYAFRATKDTRRWRPEHSTFPALRSNRVKISFQNDRGFVATASGMMRCLLCKPGHAHFEMASRSMAEKSAISDSIEEQESASRMLDFSPQGKLFLPFSATLISKKMVPLLRAFFWKIRHTFERCQPSYCQVKSDLEERSALPNEV
jgi:hypothetical protein